MKLMLQSAGQLCAVALTAALLVGTPTTSTAIPLPNGGTVVPNNTAGFAGGTVITSLSGNFDTDPVFGLQGTYISAVVRAANGVTLDFYYQFSVLGQGPQHDPLDGISRFSLASYDAFLTDVTFDASGATAAALGLGIQGNQAPSTADRSLGGGTVAFNFSVGGPEVTVGETTNWLRVSTNATAFTTGIGGFINGGADRDTIFTPIPEPATGLFGLALLGMVTAARPRRSRELAL